MKIKGKHILVCGAGGFIGGHLVRKLLESGAATVRAVDVKPISEWHQVSDDAENIEVDLSFRENCFAAVQGNSIVFQLAADMGGMGFIESNRALCMLNVLINTHMLLAARDYSVERFFFSSSACVYNLARQASPLVVPLREEDAYPAMPEDGYGWEKLFSERMCRHFEEDFGIPCRIARYHNVYGPMGTWQGGREKAPAAICRKVLEAKLHGIPEIEIWGDGSQTRSFLYIDDCIQGTIGIAGSNVPGPINLGSSELVTIDQLVSMVEDIAGMRLKRHYNRCAPTGVNGRNSDNTRISHVLQWEPSIPLVEGLKSTYNWIEQEMVQDSTHQTRLELRKHYATEGRD
jgi:nucleoside-diphosphate-sugar epimerase